MKKHPTSKKPSMGRPQGKTQGKPQKRARPATYATRPNRPEHDPSALATAGDGWLVGRHAVEAALTAGRRRVMEVYLAAPPHEAAAFRQKHPLVKTLATSRGALDAQFPDTAHNGIAARVGSLPQPTLEDVLEQAPDLIVALDHVTDPHNVGAILRSCAAFGAGALLSTGRHSAGLTPAVAKAAAGGLESVPFVTIGNLAQTLERLKDAGYTVIGLAGEGSTPLETLSPAGKCCVVMGSEGEGLRELTRKKCDTLVHIPISPAMESLNVSVAAGIVLARLFALRA